MGSYVNVLEFGTSTFRPHEPQPVMVDQLCRRILTKIRHIEYELVYTTVYDAVVVVFRLFEVFHSSPSRRFPFRNSQSLFAPLLEVAGNTMEDEVKKLLEVVNKLEPSLSDPVHSTELKLVS